MFLDKLVGPKSRIIGFPVEQNNSTELWASLLSKLKVALAPPLAPADPKSEFVYRAPVEDLIEPLMFSETSFVEDQKLPNKRNICNKLKDAHRKLRTSV